MSIHGCGLLLPGTHQVPEFRQTQGEIGRMDYIQNMFRSLVHSRITIFFHRKFVNFMRIPDMEIAIPLVLLLLYISQWVSVTTLPLA